MYERDVAVCEENEHVYVLGREELEGRVKDVRKIDLQI